jgi:hypothetical protein
MATWAGTATPGWASRFSIPAGPLPSVCPGWPAPPRPAPAGPAPPRPAPAGLLRLAFLRLGRRCVPRLGRLRRPRPGRDVLPGWAGSFAPGRARMCCPAGPVPSPPVGPRCAPQPGPAFPQAGIYFLRLGCLVCTIPAGPGRDSLARAGLFPPGRIIPLVGRDIHSWAGLLLSRADIYSLRDLFLVQHRLQRIVPVLGRLQARTGISFTIICWSWDAPWLRPAYPSSPSQSYPQEEDKTDDMVILKTDARRRRPRTPSTDIDGTSP